MPRNLVQGRLPLPQFEREAGRNLLAHQADVVEHHRRQRFRGVSRGCHLEAHFLEVFLELPQPGFGDLDVPVDEAAELVGGVSESTKRKNQNARRRIENRRF